jgi:hypothetical protein
MSRKAYGENTFNYFEFGLADSGYVYLDFDTMGDGELKETFSHDDFFSDDSDESLFDLDIISIAKDVKKSSKVLVKA